MNEDKAHGNNQQSSREVAEPEEEDLELAQDGDHKKDEEYDQDENIPGQIKDDSR